MKTSLVTCLCSIAFALPLFSQTPTVSPEASLAPSPSATVSATLSPVPAASSSPAVAASASPDSDEDFDSAIEKKIRKHFKGSVDGDHPGTGPDIPWLAIPIVLIVFLAIFGTPVMIVGLIMYFSFSKSRAMHRTVRMMVEKGQPVPEALLNPPPVVRQRSDLRRGVVLLMVGLGLMVFLGAVNDWEGGAWSLGIIPFLIGAGYFLVWRLDVRREDNSPGA
ncbi:MAG: DUF6249 domain-containing protein [Verrucomicrobiota bacterium]|nr:DUF6249 domain-containing protein [Verrucomicrobiota bacterium]